MSKFVGKLNRESLKISNLIDTRRSSMASKNYSRRSSFVKVDGDETQSGTLGKTAETRELEDSDNHNIIQLHVSLKI